MRGYSHLSDDEREQIGSLKVLGHSIGPAFQVGHVLSGSSPRA